MGVVVGYGMCSTGQHMAWTSVGGFQSFQCDCPPHEVKKVAAWMPVTVETVIDMGGWDTLSPTQQTAYLARQASLEAWRRSWRGRWFRFTQWFHATARRLARWPQPEFVDDEEWA